MISTFDSIILDPHILRGVETFCNLKTRRNKFPNADELLAIQKSLRLLQTHPSTHDFLHKFQIDFKKAYKTCLDEGDYSAQQTCLTHLDPIVPPIFQQYNCNFNDLYKMTELSEDYVPRRSMYRYSTFDRENNWNCYGGGC